MLRGRKGFLSRQGRDKNRETQNSLSLPLRIGIRATKKMQKFPFAFFGPFLRSREAALAVKLWGREVFCIFVAY
jgi:hypothetical protein